MQEKCHFCGACVSACPKGCHKIDDGRHEINRELCKACGACVQACPYSVLSVKGEKKFVKDILAIVAEDREFYDASGGGMTISGGEPLGQFEFTRELLFEAKKMGVHICVETCGFAPTEKIVQIKDDTDIFLFDFKESDPEKHLQFTGVDNALIMKNLFELDRLGSKIILRCPIIPGLNDRDSHLMAIAGLANRLRNILEVNVMPYHPMGRSKSKSIGREYPLESIDFAQKAELEKWLESIKQRTDVIVKKG